MKTNKATRTITKKGRSNNYESGPLTKREKQLLSVLKNANREIRRLEHALEKQSALISTLNYSVDAESASFGVADCLNEAIELLS
jgi:hypothetical protein